MTDVETRGYFAGDLAKMYNLMLSGDRTTLKQKLSFWIFNSEFHSVAAFRFGQWAGRLRERRKLVGVAALVVYKLWNRWITHIHHCEINHWAQIGPGLFLWHRHGVTIGPSVIGSNCVIHQNVTIGQRVAGGDQGTPVIGKNVWIGPGATISGGITVGDGATISAGTVLSKSVPAGALVGGNPGRVIALDYDNSAMLNYSMPEDV